MAIELLGRPVAQFVLDDLKITLSDIKQKTGLVPGLAVVLVGENPASQAYVGMKKKACHEIGIASFEHLLPANTSEETLSNLLIQLNEDPKVHGILLQLPLPKGMEEAKLLELIAPEKDVDGFHPINIGNVLIGQPALKPCTPYGVCELLKYYKIPTEGKHVVIVGRSNIVGKPVAAMLIQKEFNATVTICHSKSENLSSLTQQADILIAAIGKPRFITADMVKPHAVIIDVGINRVSDDSEKGFRLVGDVDYDSVFPIVSAITPVPKGVGPMTIAMLMKNTVQAFKKGLL